MVRGWKRIILSRCDVITFMLQGSFTVEVVLQGHCSGYPRRKTYTFTNSSRFRHTSSALQLAFDIADYLIQTS